MEQPVLTDKNQFPTDDIIFSHLGKRQALWLSFFDFVHAAYPDFTEQWRYYNDGKSWLFKASRKSKTIFWLSVAGNSFRVTAYFADKARKTVMTSTLSKELKEQFESGKKFNTIRGLTITFKSKRDVEHAKVLITLKATLT